MKEETISFETAKLAKKKGLEPDRGYYYDKNGKLYGVSGSIYYAPTQSLLQKWLREEHKLDIVIDSCWSNKSKTIKEYIPWVLDRPGEEVEDEAPEYYPTYEEALESALKEALNLIK